MYIPSAFAVNDESRLMGFLQRYSFATLVSEENGNLLATHLPLLLDQERRVLRGHVARANPHWQAMDGKREMLAIFQGPQAYISPAWYVAAPAVPTWNYAVVHVYGAPLITSESELGKLVDDLTSRFENPHSPANAVPADFRANLLRSIVGFEMPVARLEGKFKLGQNRSADDQASMLSRLRAGTSHEQELAEFIQAQLVAPDC